MDNDRKLRKIASAAYRKVRYFMDYKSVISAEKSNDLIANLLMEDRPFLIGRLGAVEMHLVSRWMRNQSYKKKEIEQANIAAGIFPATNEVINQFVYRYTESIKSCDVLGVWVVKDEKKAIKKFCPNADLIPSWAAEPYYFLEPWSAHLQNKRVLIVHPFIDSIRKQLEHRDKIWPGKQILPEFKSVDFVRAVQSNARGKTQYKDWFQALDSMFCEVSKKDYDVAIIGAGAYGLPIGSFIRGEKKQAILMAGATQILFGIKGRRWDENPKISKFYNDYWIRPSEHEKPKEAEKVEGGCYW